MSSSGSSAAVYIAVMALVTYGIRVLPLTLIRREIRSRRVRAFLHYVPYATLTAMAFPAMIWSTRSVWSGAAAFAAAVAFGWARRSLLTVSIAAVAAVLIVEYFLL